MKHIVAIVALVVTIMSATVSAQLNYCERTSDCKVNIVDPVCCKNNLCQYPTTEFNSTSICNAGAMCDVQTDCDFGLFCVNGQCTDVMINIALIIGLAVGGFVLVFIIGPLVLCFCCGLACFSSRRRVVYSGPVATTSSVVVSSGGYQQI